MKWGLTGGGGAEAPGYCSMLAIFEQLIILMSPVWTGTASGTSTIGGSTIGGFFILCDKSIPIRTAMTEAKTQMITIIRADLPVCSLGLGWRAGHESDRTFWPTSQHATSVYSFPAAEKHGLLVSSVTSKSRKLCTTYLSCSKGYLADHSGTSSSWGLYLHN